MIHTAKFYVELNQTDVYFLQRKYRKEITQINIIHQGITTKFIYKFGQWTMNVNIDFIEILGKCDIVQNDIEEIKTILNSYLYTIFEDLKRELILIRLDYRFDIKVMDKKKREVLMLLYKKTTDKHRFQRKNGKYKTTIYFNSKSIHSIAYLKEEERIDKKGVVREWEENVMRFEVRLQNKHLNYMKRNYGLQKSLDNYLNKNFWDNYMHKNLGAILYSGDYYTIYHADKIIAKSALKENDKKFVREFLIDVSKKGIAGSKKIVDVSKEEIPLTIKQEEKEGKKEKGKVKFKYSRYKFNRAINLLSQIHINPILIPINLKNSPSSIKNPFNIDEVYTEHSSWQSIA